MAERRKLLSLALLALAAAITTAAAAQEKPADPALTLERIFAGREFAPERFGPARWMTDGETYTTLEPSAEFKDGRDLVLYKAESGERRVLVAAAKLVPPGTEGPLAIENYAWSPDGKVLSSSPTRSASGGRTRAATSGPSTWRRAICASSGRDSSRRESPHELFA